MRTMLLGHLLGSVHLPEPAVSLPPAANETLAVAGYMVLEPVRPASERALVSGASGRYRRRRRRPT